MARRATPGKQRPTPQGSAESAAAARVKTRLVAEQPRSLQQHVEQLERDLADARSRISELEASQRQIADRIAWALDSLRDLMEEDG